MSQSITIHLDGVEREFDLSTLLISESRDMKRLIGITTRAAFLEGLTESDPDAIAFLWWLANKRAGTPLEGKFLDIDFDIEGMVITVPVTEEPEPAAEEDADPDLPTGSVEGQDSPTP